tara:strand:+ start:401 stop:1204 length:804 start_codon:yes stop_codon:yes gene_type:complete
MTFKMKGSSLYGKVNLNRGGNANRPDGRAKSSAFQKDTDPPAKPDMDKQQNIANPDGGTWKESGRPKTYKSLQKDGTYEVKTNPSGSFSKSTDDLVDKHVTKKQDAAARHQSVQDFVTKENKKSQEKEDRKKTVKNVKKNVSNFFTGDGPGGRKEKKRVKKHNKQLEKSKKPVKNTGPDPEYVAYQKSLEPGGANYKGGAPMKKSPMEKGKTTTVDKVKSAGKAIWDTLKQEWRDPAGHGTNDSTSHRVAGHYSKRKKQARREAEKK